jgi:hypothetical protein
VPVGHPPLKLLRAPVPGIRAGFARRDDTDPDDIEFDARSSLPTISQLVRKGRKPAIKKVKAPALRRTLNTLEQTTSGAASACRS